MEVIGRKNSSGNVQLWEWTIKTSQQGALSSKRYAKLLISIGLLTSRKIRATTLMTFPHHTVTSSLALFLGKVGGKIAGTKTMVLTKPNFDYDNKAPRLGKNLSLQDLRQKNKTKTRNKNWDTNYYKIRTSSKQNQGDHPWSHLSEI